MLNVSTDTLNIFSRFEAINFAWAKSIYCLYDNQGLWDGWIDVYKETYWNLMQLQVWLAELQLHRSFCSFKPCRPPKRYMESWYVIAE